MSTLYSRTVALPGGTLEFFGSALVSGRAVYFLRRHSHDIALVAGLKREEQRPFLAGRVVAFEYRVWPGGEATPEEISLLEQFTHRLLAREDALARSLGDQRESADVRSGLLLVSRASAGGVSTFRLRPNEGENRVIISLHVASRGVLDADLMSWSVRVESCPPNLRGRVQQYVLGVLARYLLDLHEPGPPGERSDSESKSSLKYAYFDLGRPSVIRRSIDSLGDLAGESLVVTIAVPSSCHNQCVFCCPADVLDRGKPPSARHLLKRLDNVLRLMAHKIVGCTRFDVVLAGRDCLESDAFFPILARLREETRIARLSIVTPGTRLADKRFVQNLKRWSIDSVMLTLLGPNSKVHDIVAGRAGAFADLMLSIQNLKEAGIQWELNTVVVNHNLEYLGKTVALGAGLGAKVRMYIYISEPIVPMEQARACAPRFTSVVEQMNRDRAAVEAGVLSIHYLPLCLVPDWALPLVGHSAQSFPDLPDELPVACTRCAAWRVRCLSVGRHYLELYGASELRPIR